MRHISTLIALVLLAGCSVEPAQPPQDWPEPMADTCQEYTPVFEPEFVVAYFETDDVFLTDPVYIVGLMADTVYQDEMHLLGQKLDSMFSATWPQYGFSVYVNDGDSRLIAVIVHGTNNRQQFYLKAQVRYNGLKHYFGWTTQYFTFSGALTAPEYLSVATSLQSVDAFNFRRTEYDSSEYDAIGRAILGSCKAGRYWANFQHGGPWRASLLDSFSMAGWSFVTSLSGDSGPDTQHPLTYDEFSLSLDGMIAAQERGAQVIVSPNKTGNEGVSHR